MYYRRNPQRNCRNNCNQRPCQNNNCQNSNCNGGDSCDCEPHHRNEQCCEQQSCCSEPKCHPEPRCCPEPKCHPHYNEADYQVDAIHALFDEYCQIERRADSHFNNALANLCDAIEEIEKGLECNHEGHVVWMKMEHWLARYYERFGEYCGCIEKMEEFRFFVKKLLIHEWAALEATKMAHAQLENSRALDKELYGLRCDIHEHCLPKC